MQGSQRRGIGEVLFEDEGVDWVDDDVLVAVNDQRWLSEDAMATCCGHLR
jgi:hypothetical protein